MTKSNFYYFSTKNRAENITVASQEKYDVIIIGGGVTGCGIALDAVTRGLSVLLVEKKDFASGTSSKSTKLIHGGLRYLKQLEIGLVRETGTERAIVHKNAPHLVHPEKMLLPIVEGGTFGRITAGLAISVYDFLASVAPEDKKVSLDTEETIIAEPLLDKSILKGGVIYSEYRTDDARLTIELMKAAVRNGATAFNYCKMSELIYGENGQIIGIECQDEILQNKITFRGKFVISAAGPWVDKIREKDNSLKGNSLHLTKGVHIVVPKEKLPLHHANYFDAFDGRMIFAIPRGKVTYIGTSDTDYSSSLNRVLCSAKDADYLIGTVNRMFPSVDLKRADIVSSWAGLRPLIHQEGKSASELSRKDEIFESEQGLISIAGGKLTGYRKMAKRIIDLILEKDETLPQEKSQTRELAILEDSYENYKEVVEEIKLLEDEIIQHGLSDYYAWYLISTYGSAHKWILDHFIDSITDEEDVEKTFIKSELVYCIKYESIARPDDFLIRRTGRLYFDVESVNKYLDVVIDEMSIQFHWSSDQVKTYYDEMIMLIGDATLADI